MNKLFMLFTVCALGFSACNNDDGGKVYETVWGSVFIGVQSSDPTSPITIYGDDNRVYEVEDNKVKWFPFAEGQRVIIGFNSLDSDASTGGKTNIRLLAIDSIRNKDILLSSELSTEQFNELGDDPIYIYNAWLGGYDKSSSKALFLNMQCEIHYNNTGIRHALNAVLDEENSTSDSKIINIRHNADEDGNAYIGYSRISFDLANVLESYSQAATIALNWYNYAGQYKSATITYDGNLAGVENQDGFSNTDQRTEGTYMLPLN